MNWLPDASMDNQVNSDWRRSFRCFQGLLVGKRRGQNQIDKVAEHYFGNTL